MQFPKILRSIATSAALATTTLTGGGCKSGPQTAADKTMCALASRDAEIGEQSRLNLPVVKPKTVFTPTPRKTDFPYNQSLAVRLATSPEKIAIQPTTYR